MSSTLIAVQEAALTEKLSSLNLRDETLGAREAALQQREMAVPRREEAVAQREQTLIPREERLNALQANLQQRERWRSGSNSRSRRKSLTCLPLSRL